MQKSRLLTGIVTVGTVAIASLFAAAPASAATLPSGQKITVVDYFEFASQFYNANPADATLTPVGSAQSWELDQFSGIDVDDDGHGYAIANFSGDGGPGSALFTADANTGVLSDATQIYIDFGLGQFSATSCQAIDYTAGQIMAICELDLGGGPVAYWGTIDPDAAPGEAWLDIIYVFDSDYVFFDSMAIDPVTGTVYAIGYPDGPALYTLDPDTGETFVTYLDNPAYGFDFDRSGQAWVTTEIEVDLPESDPFIASALATLDLNDGTNPFIEPMTDEGGYFGDPLVRPLTVWGHPALPATGPADTSVPLVAAALLLLAGTILAGVTVLRRRETA